MADFIPKNIPASVKKRLVDWSDERRTEGRYFLATAYGWAFEPSDNEDIALHCKSFGTRKEAFDYVMKYVKPCSCGRCIRGKE